MKTNIIIVKAKRCVLPLIFIFFTVSLLLFSRSNLPAVKSGLKLWANSVIPSLFPFFVATELLMHTDLVFQLGVILNNCMKPLFNIRGEGAFVFIMGIISGYPMGAKLATNFRKNNICSEEECERLLSFTNNSGPLFIIGTVGILMYGNTAIGVLLFITHILACITVGFIFRFWKYSDSSISHNSHHIIKSKQTPVTFSNLGSILSESITNSISTILLIGGFVVIFSSIISILKSSGLLSVFSISISPILAFFNIDSSFATPLISGFLEITNGINSISNISNKKISTNLIFTAFLLGFGGISVLLQVFSITSKSDLSIKPYVYGKLLHGVLAAFYTYIFTSFIPFFNFDL
ncbi:MAG: sporulation integral membrane protein YlbJ [Clostridiales bacterium]|nr:sporulation integral membrane protein YlbJ [Clostridiales bacterium]